MDSQPHTLTTNDLGITYFSPPEFGDWWSLMDPRWLVCADLLRERAGLIMRISPVKGAIGRHAGEDAQSDHNIDRWGRVYGVDVLPRWRVLGPGDKTMMAQVFRFFELATACGFSAIGYYPDWRDACGEHNPGFHLGTRRNRKAGNPATWGRLTLDDGAKQYVSFFAALQETQSRIA